MRPPPIVRQHAFAPLVDLTTRQVLASSACWMHRPPEGVVELLHGIDDAPRTPSALLDWLEDHPDAQNLHHAYVAKYRDRIYESWPY